jgi:hypothetical protein
MREWPRLHPNQQRRVKRLRRAGICVLVGGVLLARLVYRAALANYTPTVRELLPNSAALIDRQRGILFGRGGLAMFDWFDALQQPAGQAALVVIAGVIGAITLYQVAHHIEADQR